MKLSIDLSKLFKREQPKPEPDVQPGAAVAAIVVSKSILKDSASRMVLAAGFKADVVEEQDAAWLFKQEEVAEAPVHVLMVNKEVGVAVANVQKEFWAYDFATTDFNELMAQEGLIPGLMMACEKLESVMGNCLYKAANPSEAENMITNAITQFQAYTSGLLKAVPQAAFKAEKIRFVEADYVSATKEEPEVQPETVVTKEEVPQTPEAETKTDAVVDTPAEGAEGEGQKGPEVSVEQPVAKTELSPEMKELVATLKGEMQGLVQEAVKPVNDQLAGFKTELAGVVKQVGEVRELATKTEKTVKGVVPAPAPEEKVHTDIKKSEVSGGMIDTAFHRPE